MYRRIYQYQLDAVLDLWETAEVDGKATIMVGSSNLI